MRFRFRRCSGFSLIELLVVLAILGILSMVGLSMLGDRKGSAVRGVMDEIEGVLMAAQRNAASTGTDVTLLASGKWTDGSDKLTIDGRRWDPTKTPDITKPDTRLGSTSEVFTSHYFGGARDHRSAGVDKGDTAINLNTVSPCKDDPFKTALDNNLCTGAVKTVVINGTTKRFMTGFYIVVTGLQGGSPAANGPVGVIVVPGNMTSVFKFYKREGETQWRRL